MHPLDINLASHPFRNNTLLWLGYSLATLGLLVSTGWMVHTYIDHRDMLADVKQRVGDFESESTSLRQRAARAQLAIDRYDLKSLKLRAEKANEVIDWKAFSWTRLFNIMAEIQPYYVRMTSVRPIFRSERGGENQLPVAEGERLIPVAVQGVAKSVTAIGELQTALMSDPHFRRVEPERFVRAENGELNFELRFYYRPDAEPQADIDAEQLVAEVERDEPAGPAVVATEAVGADTVVEPPRVTIPKVTAVEVEEDFPSAEENPDANADALQGDADEPVVEQPPQRTPVQPSRRGKRPGRQPTRRGDNASPGDDK